MSEHSHSPSGFASLKDCCERFEAAWKARPNITEFVAAAAGGPETNARLVRELLLLDLHYRRRQGDTPAAADYLSRLPQYTDVIREVLPPAAETPSRSDDASTLPYLPISRGDGELATTSNGRFRVVAPHARGGLGEVFRALDQELHREVALKEIQAPFASDPSSRRRFAMEAEVTGQLEHPGIVPVYSLAAHPDGRPYYAMRFIRGDSLKDAIAVFHARRAENPSPSDLELRQLLGRFVQVCNAIAYAHSRGVIHRDIKPANIMLGEFGETLVVDWGLAKRLGNTDDVHLSLVATSTTDETQPGVILGTPAYMSPEQARGDVERITSASDLYSLGATLYHLLTGQPPFMAKNLDEPGERIAMGDYNSPRRLQPWIPKSLDAICLKAMSADVHDRYSSAKELAEEVEHFLADERVTAYRGTLRERGARWLRKHPALAATTAATLALMAMGAGLAAWQQNAHAKALTLQTVRAEARETIAIDAIKKFRDAVANNRVLKNRPALQGLRSALLREPLEFFQKLREQLQDDIDNQPESLDRLASALYELGNLTSEIGDKRDAIRAFEELLAIWDRLARANPTFTEFQRRLAAVHSQIGLLLGETGKPDEALAACERARGIQERLARENPAVTEFRSGLALSHNNIGNLLRATGKPDEALGAFERAREFQEQLAIENPNDTEFQRNLAVSHNNIGLLLSTTGKPDESLAAYGRAREILKRLAKENPAVSEFPSKLAKVHINIGNLLRATSSAADALAAYERARGIQERLARENPSVTEFQSDLAKSHLNIGVLLSDTGKPGEALRAYERARGIQERLARENPTVTEFQSDLAKSHLNIGVLLSDTGKLDEALAAYRRAREIQELLARKNLAVTDYQRDLALCHDHIGELLRDTDKPDEALAAYERAREIQERLAGENPSVKEFQSDLASSHNSIGHLLRATGKLGEALAAYERALNIRERLANNAPTVAEFQSDLAASHHNIGLLLRATGKPNEALTAYERALEMQGRLVRENPAVTKYQRDLGLIHHNIGILLCATGNLAEALAAYEQALNTRVRLARENPTVTEFQSDLAASHNNIGLLLRTTGKPVEALTECERALEILERLAPENSSMAQIQIDLGGTLNNIAMIHLDDRRHAEARDLLEKAVHWQKRALAANPKDSTSRQFLKNHYRYLLTAADGLKDVGLAAETRRGLAELAASDPQFAMIDRRLADVLAGQPAQGGQELFEFARRAYDMQRFGVAARFFSDSLRADATLAKDRKTQPAYNAACSAALAGGGQGLDDPPADADAQAKLRAQALGWLNEELSEWSKFIESAPAEQRPIVFQTLTHWQNDVDLAGVRGDAIENLPEPEREPWRALWQRVQSLRIQSQR